MNQIHILKAEIAKLPREEVDKLALGLMTMLSSVPFASEAANILAVTAPEAFKGGTHAAVVWTIDFMVETGGKIRREIEEMN